MSAAQRHNATVVGKGAKVVVLSHGFGTDQRVWKHMVPALSKRYRVLTYDLACAWSVDGDVLDIRRHASLEGYVEDLHLVLNDVAVLLRSPRTANEEETERTVRAAAAKLGLDLVFFSAETPADFAPVFDRIRAANAEALLIDSYPGFIGNAAALAELATASRIPTACPWADAAQLGCFIGYSASRDALLVRLAHFVARIFRGATPAELPLSRGLVNVAQTFPSVAVLAFAMPAQLRGVGPSHRCTDRIQSTLADASSAFLLCTPS